MTEPLRRRTRSRTDPLAGLARLVVDVDNVLGALRRSGTSVAPTTLIGRIRAIAPAEATVELVFDGPATRGIARPAPGVVARFAAPRTADELILDLLRAAGVPRPGDDPAILLVTDDVELRRAAVRLGAATAGTRWLIERTARTSVGGPSVGQARPPASTPPPTEDDEKRWHPGRGATVKRGNARRPGRHRRAGGRPAAG